MADSSPFPQLVSLACHDLRTPLATVAGFAGMLARDPELGEQSARYVGMMEAAVAQLADLLDQLALAARIESGRFESALAQVDTLDLAAAAAARLGEDRAEARGEGAGVEVDSEWTERAVAALALAALRHGSLDRVELVASGPEIRVGPVAPNTAPIVLGEELRDLGAAVAVRLLRELGGSVELEDDALRVTLPSEGAARDGGP